MARFNTASLVARCVDFLRMLGWTLAGVARASALGTHLDYLLLLAHCAWSVEEREKDSLNALAGDWESGSGTANSGYPNLLPCFPASCMPDGLVLVFILSPSA